MVEFGRSLPLNESYSRSRGQAGDSELALSTRCRHSQQGLRDVCLLAGSGSPKFPISNEDCNVEVTVTTDNPSDLIVYLVDPYGNIRRPSYPHWNGGEIKPIHYWNGGHWENDEDEFRSWIIEPHTEFSVNVNNPMEGKWTAIVVPYLNKDTHEANFNGNYEISIKMKKQNQNRISAALSAANGAVLASLNHYPLLYVNHDAIPAETSDAISNLGISNILFVNIDNVGSVTPSGTVTEYTTLKEIIDVIKSNQNSENYITITSLATGDGYFAPSAMIAAYHGSPVLNIGEAKEAYNVLDQMSTWEEYAGDYYHGCRSVGHLPSMLEPFDFREFLQNALKGEFPLPGFDLKLRWFSKAYDGIFNLINNYNLDKDGKEVYMFISPRDNDIRGYTCRTVVGNNSYAGHIPVETTGFASDIICRSILYPALIYANPGRDIVSCVLMNFRNGHEWKCNDLNKYPDHISQILKESGFSRGRFFEGHTLWENILERYNEGVGLIYHCSHGTGGSGTCCMYKNIEEQFPLAQIRYEHLRDFDWWDGWRGYYYDNAQTNTPRNDGLVWFNADEPNLYDIVHFKYHDQLFDNLHSQFNLWQSCTTGKHFGPIIYLEHGAVIAYSNGNTGRSPQTEVIDSWILEDMLKEGISIGEAQSNYYWMFERDYTTMDPNTLYGPSSMDCGADNLGDCDGLANIPVIFGDPTIQIYSPEWIEPNPINANN